ncbi:unnamed protein product, partial [Vitis vinifera]
MNNFEGLQIPKFIGSFKRLRYLNLSGASFGGTIPPHLGNLSSLLYLDLNSYSLESVEDDLHWLSGLSSLRHLNLGNIDLSKAAAYWHRAVNSLSSLLELRLPRCGLSSLPDLPLPFFNVTSLLVLDLSNNDFNSSIPHWLFNFSSLAYLDLNSNNLQGSVPEGFGYLISLKYIDFSSNLFIGGHLPRDLGKLCNLRTLKLSFNSISGEITEFMDGLSECNLKSLHLWSNSFVGSIPNSIGNFVGQLSALVALDLSENPWVGVVTESHFSNLTSLTELAIKKDNLFSGPIPRDVGKTMPWLTNFDVSWNSLNGTIPLSIGKITGLASLVLSNNHLSGEIPLIWNDKPDLYIVDMENNSLSGEIPSSMGTLNSLIWLETLDLGFNDLGGFLPNSLGKLYNLKFLWLWDNSFVGSIPSSIGNLSMPMLTDLDLSSNALNGTIPLSFGKLNNLLTLVISNNHLSGGIPEFWNGLPYLYAIDMNNNNLSGELPSSMGSLRFLRFLMISNNHLSGQLPSALQNCTGIHTLDLGGNRFSGNVPAWIGERMPNLLILRLRSNLFHGSIPSQLCTLSSLHILDLGENNFSGFIPSCVGNLSGMASEIDSQRYEGELMVLRKGREDLYKSILYLVNSMDLSDSNLCGEVPEGVTNLSRLGTLNLSINHLTGKIPDNIGSLQGLETLDLSRNHLSCVIPPGMASLTSLNHLNLSYNNLSGRIPTGNQLQTLDDPSIYENNPALCGPPTTAKCPGDDQRPKTRSGDNVEDENENGDGFEMKWFYMSMGPGFAVGFWGVCVTLIVKNSWRHAYFRLVYDVKEWLLMVISLNVARLRRKLNLGSI